MVVCHGCGNAFGVPAGYSRAKIQCPACGVICSACSAPASVGEAAREPAVARSGPPAAQKASAADDDAAAWLRQPDMELEEVLPASASKPARKPAVEESTPPPAPKQRELLVPCRRCGRQVRRQRECPHCDRELETPLPVEPTVETAQSPTVLEALPVEPNDEPLPLDMEPDFVLTPPAPRESPHRAEPPPPRRPLALELEEDQPTDQPLWTNDDEDAAPYVATDTNLPHCPKCRTRMKPDAVLCTSCGYNLRTRKKEKRTYQAMARTWETNQPLLVRLAWFLGIEAMHVFLMMLSVLAGGSFWPFVFSGGLLTMVAAFISGTYETVEITRDTRGRVKVRKYWRACFIPLPVEETDVRGFEGVVTGQWLDAGFWEYFVLFTLLPWGLLPAFIWWWQVCNKAHYRVALAVDHGRADVFVYRGRVQEQMQEISDFLCDATGLEVIT